MNPSKTTWVNLIDREVQKGVKYKRCFITIAVMEESALLFFLELNINRVFM